MYDYITTMHWEKLYNNNILGETVQQKCMTIQQQCIGRNYTTTNVFSSTLWDTYYGVATIRRLLKMIGLLCRISPLL